MKFLLMLLVAVSVGWGAKYTIYGNSIAAVNNVWDTMLTVLNDGSTYSNRAVGGKEWVYFDTLLLYSQVYHFAERYINTDTSDVVIVELGINNSHNMDGWPPYLTPRQTIRYLNRFYGIIKAKNKQMVLGELLPIWSIYEPNDSARQVQLDWVKSVNSIYHNWCTYQQVKLATTFDYFADSLDRPASALFNSDKIHPNTAGSGLLGRRYAAAAIPTDTQKAGVRDIYFNIPFVSSSTLRQVDLSTITDSVFWARATPSGKNIHLYSSGVEVKRILENYCPFARTGVVFYRQLAGNNVRISCKTDTSATNDSTLYADCNILRRYPCADSLSISTFKDVAGGKNGNNPSLAYRYLQVTPGVPEFSNGKKMLLQNQKSGKIATPTLSELSGATKMTIQFWLYSKDPDYVFETTNILFAWGNGNTNSFRVFYQPGNPGLGILLTTNGTLDYWTLPSSINSQVADSGWNHYAIIYDGSQDTVKNRIKFIRNGVDLSSNATCTAFPATLPTSADSLLIAGYYSGNLFPANFAFADIRVIDTCISVAANRAAYTDGTTLYIGQREPNGYSKKLNTGLNLAF